MESGLKRLNGRPREEFRKWGVSLYVRWARAELEGGQIIGMLETEAPGDETGLPPGKYNVFAAKVGNDWHVYAESGGKIVVEAVHVRVEKSNDRTPKKPEFHAEGWCSWWWLLPPWGLVTFVFTNCF